MQNKEIEQATAAKLEELIAIKVRPIHISVSKWTKQAKKQSEINRRKNQKQGERMIEKK